MLTKHNLIIGYTSLLWCSQPVGLSLSGDEWLFHKGCISDIHLEIQQQWKITVTKEHVKQHNTWVGSHYEEVY